MAYNTGLPYKTSADCVCADRREFCQFDKFEASCEHDEVVIVDTAQYGRMRAGRCISGEGYIGCSADVRVYLDGHCSGRRQCSVSVASLTDIVQPCRRDFTSYLEASYTCMKGECHAKPRGRGVGRGIPYWSLVKNERIAINGFPSHSYGTSFAIWDHTVLPATRHK